MALETILLFVALHLALGGAFAAAPARGELMAGLFTILFVRLVVNLFWIVRRVIPWPEALPIPLAFGVYTVGFALMAAARPAPLGAWDIIGILLFLGGTALHTTAEVGRHRWRGRPENRGRLYTEGAFRRLRHPNYSADVIWVAGLALLSHNVYAAIVPAVLLVFFAFGNAPLLDRHLAQHYGETYSEWRRKSWSLIPFVM